MPSRGMASSRSIAAFGSATVAPSRPVDERTLFPLFSNTKVITAAAVWTLVEEGKLRFSDRVAEHVPGFEAHGKDGVTVAHLLTHQAGFPAAEVAPECFMDRERLRRAVCEFKLEWPPATRSIYHRLAAHWVIAVLIEAITGADYRDEIRKRVIEPLGLTGEMFLGLPETEDHRAAAMYTPKQTGAMAARPDGGGTRVQARGNSGRRRLRDRTCDGRVLSDDGAGRRVERRAHRLTENDRLRDPRFHRRSRR